MVLSFKIFKTIFLSLSSTSSLLFEFNYLSIIVVLLCCLVANRKRIAMINCYLYCSFDMVPWVV